MLATMSAVKLPAAQPKARRSDGALAVGDASAISFTAEG